jgi:multiple sugar transport system substrate-binding protein
MAKESGSWLKPTCYFSVNENSKNAAEAKKFIHWLLNDVEAGGILKTERGIPVTDEVKDAIMSNMSAADLLGKEMTDKIAQNSQPFTAQPPGYNEFGKDMNTTIQSVLFNKVTPEKAYDAIQKYAADTEATLK